MIERQGIMKLIGAFLDAAGMFLRPQLMCHRQERSTSTAPTLIISMRTGG